MNNIKWNTLLWVLPLVVIALYFYGDYMYMKGLTRDWQMLEDIMGVCKVDLP